MIDRTAALLAGIDSPRAVPPPARMRLVAAIESATLAPTVENLRAILERPQRMPEQARWRLEALLTGAEEDDRDVANVMAGVDDPIALSPIARARLERRLAAERYRRAARVWQMTGAAAVAVLVLVGSVVLTRPNRDASVPGDRPGALPTLIDPTRVDSDPPAQPPVQPSVRPTQPQPRPTAVLGARFPRQPQSPGAGPQAGSGGSQGGVAADGGVAGAESDPSDVPSRRSGLGLTPEARSSRGLPAIDAASTLLGDLLRILRNAGIALDALGAPSRPPSTPDAPAPKKVSPQRSRRAAAPPASEPAAPATAPKSAPASPAIDASKVVGAVTELIEVSVLSAEEPVVSIGL